MEPNNSSFHISTLHPRSHLLLLQLSHHSHKAPGKVERLPRPFSQCSIPIPILKPPPDPKLSPSRTHTHTQQTTTVTPIPPLSLHGVRRWPTKSCIFSIRGPKKQTRPLAHSTKEGYTGEAGRVPTKGNGQSGFSLCNHPAGVARGGGGGATVWRCCNVSFWVVVCFNLFLFLPPGTKFAHDEQDARGISPRTRWLGADEGGMYECGDGAAARYPSSS